MNSCKITKEGGIQIAQGMNHNTGLQELYLNHNLISDDFCTTLS